MAEELGKKATWIQENVKGKDILTISSVNDDFLSKETSRKLDCIILKNVLEYAVNPLLLLEKGKNSLKENGQLIVIVNFGINPNNMQRRWYYFIELFTVINSYIYMEKVHFGDTWVGYVANMRLKESKVKINEKLVEKIENAFYHLDTQKKENFIPKDVLENKIDELENLKNELSVTKNNLEDTQEKLSETQEKFVKWNKLLYNERVASKKNNEEYEKLQEKFAKWNKLLYNERIASKKNNEEYKKLKEKEKQLLEKIDELNTLLYQSKKLNNAYERLSEVKLYNWLRKFKRKVNAPKVELDVQECCNVNESEKNELREREYNILIDRIKDIPVSNGQRYYKKLNYNIGIICDRFYYDSVYSAANFIYISPKNWEEIIEKTDYLLVVSTWHGLNDNEWQGISTDGRPKRELAHKIIAEADKRKIITIFYSKEDPVHFDDYLSTAKLCKYIFTTDEDMIDKYKENCNHNNVFTLRFGINPIFHNPVGLKSVKKEDGVIFSGSWMQKYEERCKDMSMIFDGVLESNNQLRIVDRNYELHSNEKYAFPPKYFQYAYKSIPHEQLQKVHKLYNWAINLNTIKESQTMFANRAYELLACGNLLISNYSVGVNSNLPMVFLIHNQNEVKHILNSLNEEEIYEVQLAGVRSVMSRNTCYDRMIEMLNCMGKAEKIDKRKVAVITSDKTDKIVEMFNNQSYPEKTLISEDEVDEDTLSNVDIIAFFDEKYDYDVFYLEDMINGFKYTDSDYITKNVYIKYDKLVKNDTEHSFTNKMSSKFRTAFWKESFDIKKLLEMSGEQTIDNGYCTDHFNFKENPLNKSKNKNYKLSVIVPIYNNGWHLYGKAFLSLRRSTMFNDMEIILVDDGSTDDFTIKMVKYLEGRYENVKTFFFNDGGSGSASRPRNKGVELSTTKYITFLDPDNEAINDAYFKMYQKIKKSKFDFVSGSLLKADKKCVVHDFFKKHFAEKGSGIIKGDAEGREFLKKHEFASISMQGAIVNKEFLIRNNLKQITGAAGEDTIFSWEWFAYAHSFEIVDLVAHVYYAARSGSTVNSISKSFFERYFKAEKPRREFLENNGLLQDYMENKFNYYFKFWYLKHLAYVSKNDIVASIKILIDIMSIYEDKYDKSDIIINNFIELCNNKDFVGAYNYVVKTFKS